jgi:hypothetical protein
MSDEPCPYVAGTVTRYCTLTPFTLTDAEREAIERGICSLVGVEDVSADAGLMDDAAACTLRELLERLRSQQLEDTGWLKRHK